MTRKMVGTVLTVAVMLLGTLAPALAQEGHEQHQMTPEQMAEMQAYMKAGTPGAPHEALASTVGSYDLKIKSWHEPDGPPMEQTGTATRTMVLGGRVLMEQLTASMMGMPFTGQAMMGYDNVSGKYWSTWNDSMSTGLMVSEGTCDDQNACSFSGSFNDPIRKGPVTMRITTRWPTPTTQIFEMHGPGKDGKEMKMMEMIYTKK